MCHFITYIVIPVPVPSSSYCKDIPAEQVQIVIRIWPNYSRHSNIYYVPSSQSLMKRFFLCGEVAGCGIKVSCWSVIAYLYCFFYPVSLVQHRSLYSTNSFPFLFLYMARRYVAMTKQFVCLCEKSPLNGGARLEHFMDYI